MKHSKLVEALNQLADDLDSEFEDINRGGCGAMAAMVGKHLERMGVVCDVATPDYGSVPAKVRNSVGDRSMPSDWDRNGMSRSHLAIRFKIGMSVRLWDTDNGVVDHIDLWELSGKAMGLGLTVQECAWISDSGVGWNSCFDRDQLPAMQERVDDVLSMFPDGCFSGIKGNRLLQFLLHRNPQVSERRC